MQSLRYALVAYVRSPVGEFIENLRRELHPDLPHLSAHLTFRPLQRSRGQDGEMSGEMGEVGMQLPPEVLNELSHRTSHVGDQRVTRVLHIRNKNYSATPPVCVTTGHSLRRVECRRSAGAGLHFATRACRGCGVRTVNSPTCSLFTVPRRWAACSVIQSSGMISPTT